MRRNVPIENEALRATARVCRRLRSERRQGFPSPATSLRTETSPPAPLQNITFLFAGRKASR